MSSAFSGLDTFQALLNTVVRILPLGVYFFTYFSLTIYKDLKVGILLLGLIFNELIGYAFKKYSGKIFNDACSIFGAVEGQGNLAFMNNEHIEIIAFVGSFFLFDMLQKDKMEWFRFNFLIFLLIITIWSRMSIGCINGLEEVVFNVFMGFVLGGLFYYFFSDKYREYEKGVFERETCDLGYSNYKCETIKNGTVIVKSPMNPAGDDGDDTNDDNNSN